MLTVDELNEANRLLKADLERVQGQKQDADRHVLRADESVADMAQQVAALQESLKVERHNRHQQALMCEQLQQQLESEREDLELLQLEHEQVQGAKNACFFFG